MSLPMATMVCRTAHGFDEQLVDPIGISFGIEHRAREIDRDESVACP
jgi:hypothetical protein